MGNWNEIRDEINVRGSIFDVTRRKYLDILSKQTGRNVIIYYSAWLQKPVAPFTDISDSDKVGFMSTINKLDRSKGLDLILHTPGGDAAATESIVDYLHSMFNDDIRAFVPQISMSAGTMIACACKKIVMGKHSSLGPIDPQIGGLPAHGVIEEFTKAAAEIKADPSKIPVWQPIIAKYPPTLIGESDKAITWTKEMVEEWLRKYMLKGDPDVDRKVSNILKELGDHALTKSHSRHLSAKKCLDTGLVIEMLEDNKDIQDAVLSIHHACNLTFSNTPAIKIIENQLGTAYIQSVGSTIIRE